MIAHRGLSALAPENTIPAFELAGQSDVFGIETDLRSTHDRVYMMFHDANLKRMTGQSGWLQDKLYEEINHLPIIEGVNNEQYTDLSIPTLNEFLEICQKYKKTPVIEIKRVIDKTDLDEVIQIIQKYGLYEDTIIISFNLFYLIYLRERYSISLQYLTKNIVNEPMLLEWCQYFKLDLGLHYRSIDHSIINRCHERGIKVNAWTVDDYKIAQQLIDWNVDYLTTNRLH